jgi:hypothetical protein
MKALRLSPQVLGLCGIVTMLASCGGAQTAMNGAVPQGETAQSRAHQASGSEDVYLYVAEENEISGGQQTEIRSLPGDSKIGAIRNFGKMCEDASGNIYITNGTSVTEYPPGATVAIAQASLPAEVIGGDCSIDPSTGNIAVAGVLRRGESRYSSWLGIYSSLSGTPVTYSNKTMASFILVRL